jgi:hypothetical protein
LLKDRAKNLLRIVWFCITTTVEVGDMNIEPTSRKRLIAIELIQWALAE